MKNRWHDDRLPSLLTRLVRRPPPICLYLLCQCKAGYGNSLEKA